MLWYANANPGPVSGGGLYLANGLGLGGGIAPTLITEQGSVNGSVGILNPGVRDSLPVALTFTSMSVEVGGSPGAPNTLDGPTPVSFAVNGVASALSLVVPAGTNGVFSVSGVVPVSAGDGISFILDGTASTAGGAGIVLGAAV